MTLEIYISMVMEQLVWAKRDIMGGVALGGVFYWLSVRSLENSNGG